VCALLEEPSSHRTSGESCGSPTNCPSSPETKLHRMARTGLRGLLIHGEVFPSVLALLVGTAPLGSQLWADTLCWRARLAGAALRPWLRPAGEQTSLLSPALPKQNLLSPPCQAAAHPLRSGSWISTFKMPLAPAFLVSRVMLPCLLLLRAPQCPPETLSAPAMVQLGTSGCMDHRTAAGVVLCPVIMAPKSLL